MPSENTGRSRVFCGTFPVEMASFMFPSRYRYTKDVFYLFYKVRKVFSSFRDVTHVSALLHKIEITLRDKWTEVLHNNLTKPKSTEKCWLEWDLNSHLRDTGPPRVFTQLKCTRFSRDNLMFIHERTSMSFSILRDNLTLIRKSIFELWEKMRLIQSYLA